MSDIANRLTDAMAAALLLELAAATISVVYIARIYWQSERRSRTFRTIVRDDVIKVVAGAWIGALAIYRLLPAPTAVSLPAWTAPISAAAIAILLWPPIDHAWTFRALRRQRTPPTPPPFGIDD